MGQIRNIGISAQQSTDYLLVRRMIHEENSSITCISWDELITNPDNLKKIDFLFTVGGDGSVAWLIGSFFKAFEKIDNIPPIVPVVRPESVGYLKQLDLFPEDSFRQGFRDLLKNKYDIINRTIFKTTLNNQEFISVNEIFLACNPHIGKFTVSLENGTKSDIITEQLADGLIISTAMGSTAWGLSHHGLISVNEQALELIFVGATHGGANFILPNEKLINIKLELKNPVVTKETVYAYTEARKKLKLPVDNNPRKTLSLVYGPRIIVDGKMVGFGLSKPLEILINSTETIPFVSIHKQSILDKARKLTETFYM